MTPGGIGFWFSVMDKGDDGHEVVRRVPWALIEERRSRIIHNFGQTPEYLAAHGGLGADEMACVLKDVDAGTNVTDDDRKALRSKYLP